MLVEMHVSVWWQDRPRDAAHLLAKELMKNRGMTADEAVQWVTGQLPPGAYADFRLCPEGIEVTPYYDSSRWTGRRTPQVAT